MTMLDFMILELEKTTRYGLVEIINNAVLINLLFSFRFGLLSFNGSVQRIFSIDIFTFLKICIL